MKNLLLLLIVFTSFKILAQGPWGVDLGFNSTNFEIDGKSGLGGQSNDGGYEIGGRYDYQYNNRLGITMGAGLAKYAGSYLGNDEGISPSSGNRISSVYDISFLNFYIRPLVMYRLNDKLNLLGGMTIEKSLKSNNQARYSFQDASFQDNNQNLKDGVPFFRYSLNLGISYNFNIELFKKNFILIPRFMIQYALNDSYKENGITIRGSSIHISSGILF